MHRDCLTFLVMEIVGDRTLLRRMVTRGGGRLTAICRSVWGLCTAVSVMAPLLLMCMCVGGVLTRSCITSPYIPSEDSFEAFGVICGVRELENS